MSSSDTSCSHPRGPAEAASAKRSNSEGGPAGLGPVGGGFGKPSRKYRYSVVLKRAVFTDFMRIATHVDRWTEDRALADRTVDSIRAFIPELSQLPHQGTRRDDLRVGLRIAAFKKRTAVAFEVDDQAKTITVLRVFYGGEDYEALFR